MTVEIPVLELEHVSVDYQTDSGTLTAVSDVSMVIRSNEIVGLIGESGSGKSTIAYAILCLLKGGASMTHGTIRVMGQDVSQMPAKALRTFRWEVVSMVFQSAMNALNPVLRIREQMRDTLLSHRPDMTPSEVSNRLQQLAEMVSLDPSRLNSYPHELSGGMRQRVIIAIALALEPKLLIMDEPTTALDVIVQRSILDEIAAIQQRAGFSILFISHDVGLVADYASRIAVMKSGKILEIADTVSLYNPEIPHHPYTNTLLDAIRDMAV